MAEFDHSKVKVIDRYFSFLEEGLMLVIDEEVFGKIFREMFRTIFFMRQMLQCIHGAIFRQTFILVRF